MRLDPMVFIQLTNLNGEELIVRVDAIVAINTAVDGGALVLMTSRHCLSVTETPDEVRLKLAAAYELASEALA